VAGNVGEVEGSVLIFAAAAAEEMLLPPAKFRVKVSAAIRHFPEFNGGVFKY